MVTFNFSFISYFECLHYISWMGQEAVKNCCHSIGKKWYEWAIVVAHQTPEVRSFNPVIGKIWKSEQCLLSTVLKRRKLKEKKPGLAHKKWPKWVQNFAKYERNTAKIAKYFKMLAKEAKFRQIWSHWISTYLSPDRGSRPSRCTARPWTRVASPSGLSSQVWPEKTKWVLR